ncbi:MAG TPA: PTS sugar transporter subunit IIA [bacterium]|nr:PTS sugar transporter subunit IIA [bacterium]
MRLLDYIAPERITLDLAARDRKAAIAEMVSLMCAQSPSEYRDKILCDVLKREEAISTAIGEGIAIPHAKCESAPGAVIAVGRAAQGIDFNALDGRPVDIIFMIVSPQRDAGLQLKILALLARLFKDRTLVDQIRAAKAPQDVISLLSRFDEATRL